MKPELEAAGLWSDALTGDRRAWFARVLALLVPRAKRLGDFAPQAAPFLADVTSYDQAAVDKHLSAPGVAHHVSALADAYRVWIRSTRPRPSACCGRSPSRAA